MAFFKFRKGGDGSPAAAPQPESVEALRRRARHRLIGAAVLVLLGVIGFPLLFDTQPRPVALDIPIEIPDRNKAKPLPAPAAAGSAARPAVRASAAPSTAAAASSSRPAAVSGAVSIAPEAAKAPPPVAAPPVPAAPAKAAPEAVAKAPSPAAPPDSARAQSLLEGKPVQAGAQEATDGRYVVQVGAFADAAKAREAHAKLAKTGLKTYTNVADTKDGKRIRVRAGPFTTREEANKAAARIKELDLPANVLTL